MAIKITPEKPKSKTRKSEESNLQQKCHTWLRNTYPETRGLYFAVMNEVDDKYLSQAERKRKGAERKARGVFKGVSDNLMLMPRGKYHGCCAECKNHNGVQSDEQKEWQKMVEAQGYFYFLYFSEEEFREVMGWYMGL